MLGYLKVNLIDLIDNKQSDEITNIISSFSCPYNADVEYFLQNKAVEFAKQKLTSTYFVFASYKEKPVLVGYFALTSKHFHIDATGNKSNLSSRLRKRISKFGTYDKELKKYIISAPLIGQLGKNYKNDYNNLITGDELLKIACDTVSEAQRIVGGKIVYLECEDTPKLVDFYKKNGFYDFGRRELDGDEKDKIKGKYLLQMLKYLG